MLLHSLMAGFSDQNKNVCILSLNYLSHLVPYLERSDIRMFLPLIANKLTTPVFTIGINGLLPAALHCLSTLAPYLERADLMFFVPHLFALLNTHPNHCEKKFLIVSVH